MITTETLTGKEIVEKTEYWSQVLSVNPSHLILAQSGLTDLIIDTIDIRRSVGLSSTLYRNRASIKADSLDFVLEYDELSGKPDYAKFTCWNHVDQKAIPDTLEVWQFNKIGISLRGVSYISPILGVRVNPIKQPAQEVSLSPNEKMKIGRTIWRGHLISDAPMIDHAQVFLQIYSKGLTLPT